MVLPSSSKNAVGPRTTGPINAATIAMATSTTRAPIANCSAQNGTYLVGRCFIDLPPVERPPFHCARAATALSRLSGAGTLCAATAHGRKKGVVVAELDTK